jgi:hypothetical protein
MNISFSRDLMLHHWVVDNQNVLFLGIYTLEDENSILPQNFGILKYSVA